MNNIKPFACTFRNIYRDFHSKYKDMYIFKYVPCQFNERWLASNTNGEIHLLAETLKELKRSIKNKT